MAEKIELLKGGEIGVRNKLNAVIEWVNALINMVGDNSIVVRISKGNGATISFNRESVRPGVPATPTLARRARIYSRDGLAIGAYYVMPLVRNDAAYDPTTDDYDINALFVDDSSTGIAGALAVNDAESGKSIPRFGVGDIVWILPETDLKRDGIVYKINGIADGCPA